jgi:hypothetical protein
MANICTSGNYEMTNEDASRLMRGKPKKVRVTRDQNQKDKRFQDT